MRRVLLARLPQLCDQDSYYWFETEMPRRYDPEGAKGIFALPLRSNWYSMLAGQHASSLAILRDLAPRVLPAAVMEDWRRPMSPGSRPIMSCTRGSAPTSGVPP